jgi:hypothetical protein
MPFTEEEFLYYSQSGEKEKDDPGMVANFAQYERELPELLSKYRGEFVAYKNGHRVAIDSDTEWLSLVLWDMYPSGSFVILPIVDVADLRKHSTV